MAWSDEAREAAAAARATHGGKGAKAPGKAKTNVGAFGSALSDEANSASKQAHAASAEVTAGKGNAQQTIALHKQALEKHRQAAEALRGAIKINRVVPGAQGKVQEMQTRMGHHAEQIRVHKMHLGVHESASLESLRESLFSNTSPPIQPQ